MRVFLTRPCISHERYFVDGQVFSILIFRKQTRGNLAHSSPIGKLPVGIILENGEQKFFIGGDIGLEIHPDTDQFLRIEQGNGVVKMGTGKENLSLQKCVSCGCAIFVPAGTWHNLVNTGNVPLKLYTIYAPPHHPHGTVHKTKADALAVEHQEEKIKSNPSMK